MKADILLGLQWGDEGKGKIVDVLAPKYDIVARFQGGPNAGHRAVPRRSRAARSRWRRPALYPQNIQKGTPDNAHPPPARRRRRARQRRFQNRHHGQRHRPDIYRQGIAPRPPHRRHRAARLRRTLPVGPRRPYRNPRGFRGIACRNSRVRGHGEGMARRHRVPARLRPHRLGALRKQGA